MRVMQIEERTTSTSYGARNRKVMLITLVLSLFVFVVSIISIYVQEVISTGNVCGCTIPLPLFIPFIASLGLFIGTLMYHLLVPVKEPINKKAVLALLNDEERKLIEALIHHKGSTSQANLVRITGIPKIRVSRMLKRLEQKKIIKKRPYGKTNMIELEDEYKKLLL